MIDEAGVYSIPMADYLADPCPEPSLSAGCCVDLLRSPWHAFNKHPRLAPGGRPDDDSEVSDVGTVAHDMLLGGEKKICVIEANDWRTKAAKEDREEARSNGLTPILVGKMAQVRAMVGAAKAFIAESAIPSVFDHGHPEQTLIAQDGDGTWYRCRPDWLNMEAPNVVLHYKTTKATAEPAAFARSIVPSMGYDVTMAFYRRVYRFLFGDRGELHLIFAQEQRPPYACSFVSLSAAAWAVADAKVDTAIKKWKRCVHLGVWPAYDHDVYYADPTPWALAQAEALVLKEME